ncbi:Uncharacterised protein [Candidatus Anstonella stagnisolia]|nr:Uncharacterised protein [Candidatus Anstonella stagnisolia]
MDLQNAFDTTGKVLFGQPVGKLSDFKEYLSETLLPYQTKKSFLSGKSVTLTNPSYPADAKFISQDEMAQLKFQPLKTNEIKDIDSLLSAVRERVVFCGNKMLGRNYEVFDVDDCVDCTNVISSNNVYNVKNGAYNSFLREAESVFGVFGVPGASFCMRCFEGVGATRCFESYYMKEIADMYFSFNCVGCSEGIFAFNLRGKRHTIGNLQLEKDKYLALKKKLVAEMGEELRKKKRMFSIVEVAVFGRDKKKIKAPEIAYDSPVPPKVEDAFRKTSKIVLGKELSNIKSYEGWLLTTSKISQKIKGASGKPTYRVDWFPVLKDLPADRLLPLDEALASAKNAIEIGKDEQPSLQEVLSRISKKAFFTFEFVDGYNQNCVDISSIFTGYESYKCFDVTNSKYCAYTCGQADTEHNFGGYMRMLHSQFCINCFNSTKLNSCFEVD